VSARQTRLWARESILVAGDDTAAGHPPTQSIFPKTIPATKIVIRFAQIPQPQYDECMNLGFTEMIFLFFLALLIFGPKKLPEIGRQVGRALNEFKRASDEFKSQIQSEINKIDVEEHKQTILAPLSEPIGSIASGSLPAETSSSSTTSTELSSQAHDA
jgi:TatA/E family protein of Tat protein translocase